MNIKNVYVLTAVSSILLIVVGALLINKSSTGATEVQESSNAKFEVVGQSVHDWGEIDIDGGVVEKTFQVKNSGTSDLIVSNIKTSCACTEAIVTINDKLSPPFGMHTRSAWKGTIKPNESAEIRVVFDPMFHGPQAVGPITRLVSLSTNDQENRIFEFSLSGNVVNK